MVCPVNRSGVVPCAVAQSRSDGVEPLAKLGARTKRKAKTWDSPRCPRAQDAWGSEGCPGFRGGAFAGTRWQIKLKPLHLHGVSGIFYSARGV
jgi:hypothetical protein